MYTEGAAAAETYPQIAYGLRMTELYSMRQLTYISDKLRAVPGILNATYGDQSYCGMPWIEFDVAILWQDPGHEVLIPAPMFPTWSWLASPGKVVFPLNRSMYGLAHWGRPSGTHQNGSSASQWIPICRGVRIHLYARVDCASWDGVAVAMAWLHGCPSVHMPEWLMLDCSRDDFIERLERNWQPDDPAHWNMLLQDNIGHIHFDNPRFRKLATAGRIITHTQKTTFALDLLPKPSL
ncbi:hypothetical protein DE146DRAFT_304513 [Phaeosphaeria sp. MPI-PUGE-AT-0046c]|nr:hypothetical protein DE146DRAFT_304513 [Phaeosphaeria sp. MPI-PUGE-AT-0046c]